MPHPYETNFLISLALTIVIETAVLWFLLRKIYARDFKKVPGSLLVFSGILTSASTLPYVWFIVPLFTNPSTFTPVAETFALVIEAIEYRFLLDTGLKKAFLISLACNAVSFLVGLWIWKA